VLTFEKISDTEVAGDEGRAPLWRIRVARANRNIEVWEAKSHRAAAVSGPQGPPHSRRFPKANDVWFQHVAIIVSDMDRA